MNERQRIAIANPMARATDPVSEFMRVLEIGSLTFSTILTVNK